MCCSNLLRSCRSHTSDVIIYIPTGIYIYTGIYVYIQYVLHIISLKLNHITIYQCDEFWNCGGACVSCFRSLLYEWFAVVFGGQVKPTVKHIANVENRRKNTVKKVPKP